MGGKMKRRLIWIPAIAFLHVAASSALCQSQSLAEYAKREKERREKITAAQKAIKKEDTGKYRAASVGTGGISSSSENPGKPGEGGETPGKSEKSDEPVDFQGRPESFWRQTFSDARQKLQELENRSNVLVLRLTDLQNEFYKEANGFRQQELQREIQKTLYEQDKTKEELEQAKASLTDLEREARKSGALPGWMSGKAP
jgi:hypothetical protein